jgi:hypothetical protein
MTRSFPVAVVILVLAGLVVTGCSTQTSAVFQALLDSPPTASGEASPGDPGTTISDSPTWWAHPHGYAMSLPTGWVAIDLDAATTEQLLSALGATMPGVEQRVRDVLAATGARGSMLAVDLGTDRDVPAMVLVLAQETDGIRPRQLKALVAEQVASLPGLRGTPIRTDERRNGTGSLRFDYAIDDPDLGALRIRSSLFRYGGQAYLVSYIAAEAALNEARSDFEAIAVSLRFGI